MFPSVKGEASDGSPFLLPVAFVIFLQLPSAFGHLLFRRPTDGAPLRQRFARTPVKSGRRRGGTSQDTQGERTSKALHEQVGFQGNATTFVQTEGVGRTKQRTAGGCMVEPKQQTGKTCGKRAVRPDVARSGSSVAANRPVVQVHCNGGPSGWNRANSFAHLTLCARASLRGLVSRAGFAYLL